VGSPVSWAGFNNRFGDEVMADRAKGRRAAGVRSFRRNRRGCCASCTRRSGITEDFAGRAWVFQHTSIAAIMELVNTLTAGGNCESAAGRFPTQWLGRKFSAA